MDNLSKRFVKDDLASKIDDLLGVGKYHDPFAFRHSVLLRNSEAGVQLALLNMDLRNEEYNEWRHFLMGCRKEKFMQVYAGLKARIQTPSDFVLHWDDLKVDSKDIPFLGAKSEEDLICYNRYRKNYSVSYVPNAKAPSKKGTILVKGF